MVFFIKTLALVFTIIWIRWTLPRLRVDQLMVMCWKYFVPIGFVCMMGSAMFVLLIQSETGAFIHLGLRILLTLCGAGVMVIFLRQAIRNVRDMKDPFYFKILE
jgi:NADH-quinone oxidoreductase subunit H